MIKRVGVPAPTPISVPGSISRSWGEVMERSYSIEFSSDTFPVSQCKAGRFPLILLNFFLTVKHFNRLCFYPALCNLNLQAFPHQTAHWIFFFFFGLLPLWIWKRAMSSNHAMAWMLCCFKIFVRQISPLSFNAASLWCSRYLWDIARFFSRM